LTPQPSKQGDAVEPVSARSGETISIDSPIMKTVTIRDRDVTHVFPNVNFAVESRDFDHSVIDRWLEQSEDAEAELTELDQLLDVIASQRAKATLSENPTRTRVARSDVAVTIADRSLDDSADFGGMILVVPGMSVGNRSAQMKAQIFDEIDDAAVVQWTVGIGFYRALELAVEADLAGAVIASDHVDVGMNVSQSDQNGTSKSDSESTESTRRAAGVVFCCLGVQYLRTRRKPAAHPK
jgi:hypothetical protein